jgi:hypothetical protein
MGLRTVAQRASTDLPGIYMDVSVYHSAKNEQLNIIVLYFFSVTLYLVESPSIKRIGGLKEVATFVLVSRSLYSCIVANMIFLPIILYSTSSEPYV